MLFAFYATNLFAQQKLITENDKKNDFSISRISDWKPQDSPSPTTRMMFDFGGEGYIGNCNVNLLESKGTATATQFDVDKNDNQKNLTASFFENSLKNGMKNLSKDLKVISVHQIKRGLYFGHMVNYTFSYFSPSLGDQVHIRAELFSHSRPGRVFSFTCMTGSLTALDAQKAFSINKGIFENFSSSLRTND